MSHIHDSPNCVKWLFAKQSIPVCPDCGNHGTCNVETGKCICKDGYFGDTCSEINETIETKTSYLFLVILLLLLLLFIAYLYKRYKDYKRTT